MDRAEARGQPGDGTNIGASEEQILEEPSRRGLIRAGQVHRVQANPSSMSAGRKKVKFKKAGDGAVDPCSAGSWEHPLV